MAYSHFLFTWRSFYSVTLIFPGSVSRISQHEETAFREGGIQKEYFLTGS